MREQERHRQSVVWVIVGLLRAYHGAGKRAQLVKPEDPSVSPQHPHKNLGWGKGGDRQILGVHCPASIARRSAPSLVRDLASKYDAEN